MDSQVLDSDGIPSLIVFFDGLSQALRLVLVVCDQLYFEGLHQTLEAFWGEAVVEQLCPVVLMVNSNKKVVDV